MVQKYSLFLILSIATSIAFVEGYLAQMGSPSSSSTGLTSFAFIWQLVTWIKKDAIQKKYHLPFDMGFFVFEAFYIVVPIYLYKTRGFKRAAFISGAFFVYVMLVLFLGSLFAEMV